MQWHKTVTRIPFVVRLKST